MSSAPDVAGGTVLTTVFGPIRALLTLIALPEAEITLLARLQRDDPVAWRQLLERYGPALVAYARRICGDAALAEELVQDAVVAVHSGIDRFEGRCSIKSWLYRAVHNRAIDALRRQRRFVDVDEAREDREWSDQFEAGQWRMAPKSWSASMDQRLDARRALHVIERALPRLPTQHREVLWLKEVEGMEAVEICDALGITPANLRMCLHRARRALRQAIALELGSAAAEALAGAEA